MASIPRQYAEQIVRKEYVELVQFDSIMFLKPSGQTIVLGSDDGLQFEKAFSAPEDIIDEPIVALFDGLPQERHPLLDGFLLIDDPDDFKSPCSDRAGMFIPGYPAARKIQYQGIGESLQETVCQDSF